MSGRKAAGGPGDGCLCLLPRGSLFLFRSGRVSALRPVWESARPAFWLSCPRCGRGRPHGCWGPCCSAASPSPPRLSPDVESQPDSWCCVRHVCTRVHTRALGWRAVHRELTHVTASQVCAWSTPVLTLPRTCSHTHSHADDPHVRMCSPSDVCPHHVLMHTRAPVRTCGHGTRPCSRTRAPRASPLMCVCRAHGRGRACTPRAHAPPPCGSAIQRGVPGPG